MKIILVFMLLFEIYLKENNHQLYTELITQNGFIKKVIAQ